MSGGEKLIKEMINFPGNAAARYVTDYMIGLTVGQAKCPKVGCENYFIFNPAQLRFPWATNGGKFIKVKRACTCGCKITTLHNKKEGRVMGVIINR